MARKKLKEEEKRKLNKENMRKLLGIYRFILPYKWKFVVGLICLLMSSFLIMAFPVLAGKLLDVASGNNWTMGAGQLMGRLKGQDAGISFNSVTQVALLLMGVLLLQSAFSYVRVYLFAIVTERSIAVLRKAVYSRMLSLPIKFLNSKRIGDMVSRMTSDIAIIQETLSITSAELFRQATMLIIGVVIIFYMVPELSLFMLAVFPAIVLLTLLFGRTLKKLSKQSQTKLAEANVVVEETLQSSLIVKAFTNEFFETNRYGRAIENTVNVALKAAKFKGAFISFIIFALFGAIVAVMWKGGTMVDAGEITTGDLVTFIMVTMFIGASIAGLGDMYGQLQRAVGASERVQEILDEEPEKAGDSKLEVKLNGHLEFKNLSFKYPDTGKEVLHNISFEVRPGEKLALVGSSGAGKSTITHLIMRFYDVVNGSILANDEDISSFPLSAFRKNIAVVPQEVLLFGGTIRENIRYGKPEATDEEVYEAAKKAYVMEFIENLDEGFDTLAGDRGIKLSGGQRQRIAIARAILKDPAILILDEATSSLDAESEVYVQQALEELMKGRTTLIIAHRLSTIRGADNIIVLRDGRIVESGTHEELEQQERGLYRHLLNLQFTEIQNPENSKSVVA
ncbi:MAG: ABC transporter transmembrane domain-containing protein [Cyclobacteriaceae bacterium]|nr:ABC transporter transmembrane domain-containing protein [Cyclobacteriaceae bacterium]